MPGSDQGFSDLLNCSEEDTNFLLSIPHLSKDFRFFQFTDLMLNGYPSFALPIQSDSNASALQIVLNNPNSFNKSLNLTLETPVPGLGGFIDLIHPGRFGMITSTHFKNFFFDSQSHFLSVSLLNGHNLHNVRASPPLSTINFDSYLELFDTDKSGEIRKLIGSHPSTGRLSLPYWTFGLSNEVHYIQKVTVFFSCFNQSSLCFS
jgi:hypothetical protein